MADPNEYVSTPAAQDEVHAYLQEVDPGKAGVTFNLPRDHFRPKSASSVQRDLEALAASGRVVMKRRSINGSRMAFMHYFWQ